MPVPGPSDDARRHARSGPGGEAGPESSDPSRPERGGDQESEGHGPDGRRQPGPGLSRGASDDLRRSLREAAVRTSRVVGVADGVGVTSGVGGDLVFAGCNEFTDAVDGLQYGGMEGPCLTAQASGGAVRSDGIGVDESRWPRFGAQAAVLGLRSVVSTPLLARGAVVGSLNLYGKTARTLSTLDDAAVALLAKTVEASLSSAFLVAVADANAHWFARAASARATIEMAVGVLMDRHGVQASEAVRLLEQRALEDGVGQSEAARRMLRHDGQG